MTRDHRAKRPRRWWPVVSAGLALTLAAASGTATMKAAAGPAIGTTDASRIVSIGGAVTEILYALGMDKRVVGIDTTSLYPPRAAAEKPSIGYMRQISAEGVLGLQPSLILTVEGAGPKEAMAVLEAAHIPLVVVPDSFSGEGIIERIRFIAQAAGAAERGQCTIEQVHADLDALRKLKAAIDKPKRVLFVLSFINGRAMASGNKTAADGIIRLAGGVNAVTEYEGYKPITDEAVIAAKPDIVLTMERSGPGTVTADAVFAHPAFAATPAAANRAFVSMEGLYLLGFGPRSARAARDLAVSLYPNLKSELLPSEREAGAHPCRE